MGKYAILFPLVFSTDALILLFKIILHETKLIGIILKFCDEIRKNFKDFEVMDTYYSKSFKLTFYEIRLNCLENVGLIRVNLIIIC